MLFASKMTFVCIPGGPAVFSQGAVAPSRSLCPGAPAAPGIFGTTSVKLASITAAIPTNAQRLWREIPDLLALTSHESGLMQRVLSAITKRGLFICVLMAFNKE